MHALQNWNWSLDGWIVVAGVLSAVAAALLGNFLVLRRMSMLGDAITHAILPGLAAAFFLSQSRSSVPMFVGAAVAGVLTAVLTEWIRGFGKVDEGASMGVVFTTVFALGLIMIVQAADRVHLDPDCVLYGAIELTPLDTWTLGPYQVPRVVIVLSVVLAVNACFLLAFYKELKISSFDPALATAVGISARVMHYVLMMLVAVTAVASFESVGNILVVAMFVVPPAAAYLITDRLPVMIGWSVVLAASSAVLGHVGALVVPAWFGFHSTTTSGMMAVAAGMLFAMAALFAPRYGVLAKFLRHRLLRSRILAEDVIAFLYRLEEKAEPLSGNRRTLQQFLMASPAAITCVLAVLRWQGAIRHAATGYQLTDRGRREAQAIIRSHRLWEHYLVSEAGLPADRIHDKAERLEHFTDDELRQRLDRETATPTVDPHGRPIPPEV